MNTREGLDWIALVSIIGILLILIVLTGLALQKIIGLDGFVVGAGTFLLSMATFYLAYTERTESISNRIQDKELAEKDRRRLRLKEQLEGLYAPLISHIDFFDKQDEHLSALTAVWKLMETMRYKYMFLARQDLQELLHKYYEIKDKRGLEKLDQLGWDSLINPIIDAIGNEYSDIFAEYQNLFV